MEPGVSRVTLLVPNIENVGKDLIQVSALESPVHRKNGLSLALAVFILLNFDTIKYVCSRTERRYPVNETHRFDKGTESCYFSGTVSDFKRDYSGCKNIYGKLIVDKLSIRNKRVALDKTVFKRVEGCVVVASLRGMEHFSMQQYIVRNRRFCGYKYALLIYGNPDLRSLYINGLRVKAERVFIKANRNIDPNEFFGMYSIMGGNIKDEIDIGTEEECTMEMARYDSRCTTLVGDVEYRPENALNKNVWSRTSKVLGTILIDRIAETSLQLPRNLFIDAWASPAVKIVNNRDLKQIDALLYIKIDGPKPWFWFENNTGFCNTIDLRKKIETKVETTINWDDECLQTCQGGKVSEKYLKRLGKFCHVLNGSLIVEGLEEIPDGLEKLNQIETISGQLKVRNNQAIRDMSFLKYGVEINDVSDFTLKGLQSLRKIRGNVLVITKDDEDVPPLVRERITTGTIDGTVKFVSLSAQHATTQKTEKAEKDTTESTTTTESPTTSIESVLITETEGAEEVREYTLGIPVLEENRDYLMSEYTKAHSTHVEIVPIIVAVGLVLAIIAIAFIVVLGLLSRRKKKIRRSKRNTNRNHPQSKTGQTTTATMTKEDVTEKAPAKSLSKKLEVVSQNHPGRPMELDLGVLRSQVGVDPYRTTREPVATLGMSWSTVVGGLESIGKMGKLG
nr:hypothetical protein HCOI_00501900 [Haemonchus contortus]